MLTLDVMGWIMYLIYQVHGIPSKSILTLGWGAAAYIQSAAAYTQGAACMVRLRKSFHIYV